MEGLRRGHEKHWCPRTPAQERGVFPGAANAVFTLSTSSEALVRQTAQKKLTQNTKSFFGNKHPQLEFCGVHPLEKGCPKVQHY